MKSTLRQRPRLAWREPDRVKIQPYWFNSENPHVGGKRLCLYRVRVVYRVHVVYRVQFQRARGPKSGNLA